MRQFSLVRRTALALLLWCTVPFLAAGTGASFVNIAPEAGIGGLSASRVLSADLNGNGKPDVIIRPFAAGAMTPLVFLHDGWDEVGTPRFVPFNGHGLPELRMADMLVFADLDNDGHLDAIITRYEDYRQDSYQPPAGDPFRSAWMPGLGGAVFGAPRVFKEAPRATTIGIAIGDVNRNGLLDIYLGNAYMKYFTGYESFSNDLLLQYVNGDGSPGFTRWAKPGENSPATAEEDGGGRPTYGAMIAQLDDGPLPMLLELNYGRRWNRLWKLMDPEPLLPVSLDGGQPLAHAFLFQDHSREAVLRGLRGVDIAPLAGFDGDEIRHGRYPEWLRTSPHIHRFPNRPDELPFRSNGNTFDAAIGDINNDGAFDVFLSTIIHAWAGDSSDRSRFLLNQWKESGEIRFVTRPELSVDRIPPEPPPGQPIPEINHRYNQGDLFAELVDLTHNGRLDLILCSSDYSDPPPYREKLRIFLQQEDGTFRDATADLGIIHTGAGMPSLADFTGDGALDLLVGQSFNRLNEERRREAGLANGSLLCEDDPVNQARPLVHLYANRLTEGRASIILDLEGDPAIGVNRDALGAVVSLTAHLDGDPDTPPVTQWRQLIGVGGHAGKQHTFLVHFGLGNAHQAERIEIRWPGRGVPPTVLENVPRGRHRVSLAESAGTLPSP